MRAGLEQTFPADNRGMFKMWMGTVLGKNIQALLESAGFLDPTWTEREVKYRSYVGHLDGLTRVLPGTAEYGPAVVELKSTADDSIANYDWPEHYAWQAFGYCLGANTSRALLYQFGREYGLSREKIIVLNDEWKTRINDHITWVESCYDLYVKVGELPPCKHLFKWEDKLCSYREVKEKKLAYNPFEPTKEETEAAEFLENHEKENT